ncbi:MAG: methionyl-tRNA formyltransferase [Eubacterium sp.]|nr:methionyl-tRNA formyltransferase [Eubacterium sp.]
MRIVFMGTPEFAVTALERICAAGHEVLSVYTQPDKPKGRSGKPAPSPVKLCAMEKKLPILQPEKLREKENAEQLRSLAPDMIVVAAYGQILSEEILNIPRLGCVNIHASLLPKYRGAAPIERSILDGEKKTGVTTMMMAKGLDTGDILEQAETEILPTDTGESLTLRLSEMGGELILSTMEKLEKGELTPVPQKEEDSSYAKMLNKEMGLLDFSRPAVELERTIRALIPWPCAYTMLEGKQMKLLEAEIVEASGESGTITEVTKKSFTIACGEKGLRIKKLQPEGKKPMDTAAFLNGNHLAPGVKLGE